MRVLILGGTTEANAIARALAADPRFAPLLSLAGRTAAPVVPDVAWRSGGFGGADGLAAYLLAERIDAVVDATHPFAARMKANAAEACRHVPRVVVLRPAWEPGPGDAWTDVATIADAAAALGTVPRRVFLTTGQGGLAAFGPPHHYLLRSVDAPGTTPPGATVITARGPFDVAGETATMRAHGTEVLVTKNAGGTAVAAKLTAARALGVPVLMIRRPAPPPGPLVPDAAGALRWLGHQAALRGV